MGKKAIIDELQFSELSKTNASKILIVNDSFEDNVKIIKEIIQTSCDAITNAYIFTNDYIAEKYVDAKVITEDRIFSNLERLEEIINDTSERNKINYDKNIKTKSMFVFHDIHEIIKNNKTARNLFMSSRHMNVIFVMINSYQNFIIDPIMRHDLSHIIVKHSDIASEPSYHRYFISNIPDKFIEICERMSIYTIKYLCIDNHIEKGKLYYLGGYDDYNIKN